MHTSMNAQIPRQESTSAPEETRMVKRVLTSDNYLNLGCLLMASSGKKSDLATLLSTGLGRYSGLVKPGQPNLQRQPQHEHLLL